MRLLRTALAAAGAATLLAAPAHATTPDGTPHWFDAEAGIPAGVDLDDVAVVDSTVIAVGEDTATHQAVVYRTTGTTWTKDEIVGLTAGESSELTDVALSSTGVAWAIGYEKDAANAKTPLVRRLDSGKWEAPAAALPDALGIPTAVAANNTGGYIGGANGNLVRFTDSDATFAQPIQGATAGNVNAISLLGSSGFAGADWASPVAPDNPAYGTDTTVRIFKLGTALTPEVAQAPESGTSIEALAASSTSTAVATDSHNRIWHLASSGWSIDDSDSVFPVTGTTLLDAAATSTTEALAGTIGSAGDVWWRKTELGTAWQREQLSATKAINSVAIVDADHMWAVGDGGVLARYWPKPPPPPDSDGDGLIDAEDACPTQAAATANGCPVVNNTQGTGDGNNTGDSGETGGSGSTGTGTGSTTTTTTTTNTGTTTTTKKTTTKTTVVQPPQETDPVESPTGKKTPRRLLINLKVVRRGGALLITFRLTRKARVSIYATRAGRVVGTTGTHKLRKGRRKLVLRFRGKPPSNLRIVVRPPGK